MMKKSIIFSVLALLLSAQAYAQNHGEYHREIDSTLFQNKCSSCHSIGLINTTDDILPSEIWCFIKRMTKHEGANLYCSEENYRIYTYIVNSIARHRTDELEQALNCLPEGRREREKQAIENAQNRYR